MDDKMGMGNGDMSDFVRDILQYEKAFCVDEYHYVESTDDAMADSTDENGTQAIVRDSRVIISIPHDTYHVRGQKVKPPEVLTGGIGRYVADRLGCSVICNLSNADPNRDAFERSAYKQRLLGMIDDDTRLVMNLHGLSDVYGVSVDIGTNPSSGMPFRSLRSAYPILSVFREHLEDGFAGTGYGRPITLNEPFDAHGDTVTGFLSERTGMPCVQLEIARALCDADNPTLLYAVTDAICAMASAVIE